MVLVWLPEIIKNFDSLQIICLFFTLPRLGWGFVAIPWVKHLKANLSFASFLLLPLMALAVGLTTGQSAALPALLIVLSLVSIPEAFTPGNWSANGQQHQDDNSEI